MLPPKFFPLVLSFSFATSICSYAETLWTNGVSENSGWFDTNKSWIGDSNLCWAAAASNIAGWWNERSQTPISSTIPSTNTEVYTDFVNKFNNTSGASDYAYAWYFGGGNMNEATYNNIFKNPTEAKAFPGYWADFVAEQNYEKPAEGAQPNYCSHVNATSTYENQTAYSSFCSEIKDLLKNGAGITLSVSPMVEGTAGHAITLWGAEFDQEGLISKIWITDSDDRWDGIFSVDISCNATTQKYGDGKETPIVEWEEVRMILKGYNGSGYYIGNATALTLPYAIPESSSFGLLAGTLTLAFVCARRKRRKK